MAIVEDARLPKRLRSDGVDSRGLERPSSRGDPPGGHLYVIFDDWFLGYTIHKIDLLFADEAKLHDAGIYATKQPSAEVAFRLPAPRGSPLCFAAFNRMIIALHPPWGPEDEVHPSVAMKMVPAFNVDLQSLSFGPRPKLACMSDDDPIYVSISDGLLVLSSSLELLETKPLHKSATLSHMSWRKLADPPFDSQFVTSHVVHPDGRTVFFTVVIPTIPTMPYGGIAKKPNISTYLFRMGEGNFMWEQHGSWRLPFLGPAYFDPELDAWIGLARFDTGHICSCNVVSAEAKDMLPESKISKECLFAKNLKERHMGATLVYLGRSKFCLVQCIQKHDESTRPLLYRMTTFSLGYDKGGNLTTGRSSLVQYYSVPSTTSRLLWQHPVAFWM